MGDGQVEGGKPFRFMTSLPSISGVQSLGSDEARYKRKGRRGKKSKEQIGEQPPRGLRYILSGVQNRRANIPTDLLPYTRGSCGPSTLPTPSLHLGIDTLGRGNVFSYSPSKIKIKLN